MVLADEPTGNLDSATGASILALLEELNQQGRRSSSSPTTTRSPPATRRRIEMLDGHVIADTSPSRSAAGADMTIAHRSGPPPRRPPPSAPGCGPPTWPPWPASGCGPASCAPALSALGIAIGVAAIVAVLGLAASSQAALLAEIPGWAPTC